MITTFVFGAVAGGAVAYFYGDQIRSYLNSTSRRVRNRAADTLQSAAEGVQSAKETFESEIGRRDRSAR
jgi:hypothetical protein